VTKIISNLTDLKKVAAWAKRHKVKSLSIDGIALEFHDKAFVSDRAVKKVFQNLVTNASKSETEEDYKRDLFYSAQ
jgi:hypothetical protein